MKQTLTKLLQNVRSSIRYRIGAAAILLVVLLAVIWIYPMQAQNISLRFWAEGLPDETVLDFKVSCEDAFEKTSTARRYACKEQAELKIAPEFWYMDALELAQKDAAEKITKIQVLSGKYESSDYVIGTVTGEKLFAEAGDAATLSDEAIREITKSYGNTWVFKLQLTLVCLGIFALVILYWLIERRFSRFQALFVCAICVGVAVFCFKMTYNNDNVMVYTGSNVENEYLDLTDGDVVAEQEITAVTRRMSNIVVYFRMDLEVNCGIVMELVREDTGEVLEKEILPTEYLKKGSITYDFEIGEPVSDVGGKYLFRVRCIDNHGSGRILAASSSEDTDEYGQLIVNGERKNKDLLMQVFYMRLQNITYARIICILAAILLIICILTMEKEKYARYLCLLIYAGMFGYALLQMLFYCHYVGKAPDESKHIAYVAYLEQEQVLLPDMPDMRAISKLYDDGKLQKAQFSDAVNYLRHPPLYYHVMRLADAVTFQADGTMLIEVRRLRLFSIGFAALAILIMFYIGYTRLAKKPYIHLLFATVCTSVPMMTFGAAGVSNDTFTLLLVTIFFLGILRLSEHRWGWKTYWLIAIGMVGTLLTKATAGILVALAGAMILGYYLITEKCYRELLRPAFLATIPLYLVAVAYYVTIFAQYGSFQPSLSDIMPMESVRNSIFYKDFHLRHYMTFAEYLHYYLKQFMNTWTGIASHVALYKLNNVGITTQTIGLLSLWILPLFCFVKSVRTKSGHIVAVGGMYAALLVTCVAQFVHAYNGFCMRGYDGSYQSRYYICAISLMAFAAALLAERADADIDTGAKYGKALKRGLMFGILCFVAMLFYENFVYFLLNFIEYPILYH